jgi:quinol monooxygenase YgiN
MTLWQDRSNWKVYIAEVWFENFAALDKWDAHFETEEAKAFGARMNAAATIIERLQYTRVDY